MKLAIDGITLSPDQNEESIEKILKDRYGLDFQFNWKIIRKSLDARDKSKIVFRYRILAELPDDVSERLLKIRPEIKIHHEIGFRAPARMKGEKICIAGSGPAGLFCALRLIEYGADVDIFERGKAVDERIDDIQRLESAGELDEESNVLFGEGGAGTYSDGKLMTRTSRPETSWFYGKLFDLGVSDEVLYDARPHIGTDRLRGLVRSIRKTILDAGSRIHFSERIEDILIVDGAVKSVVTSRGREIGCSVLVLATGHSARDMYYLLRKKAVVMEKKGFAVGMRIEHPKELINSIQYGRSKFTPLLPPADYRLAYNNKKTGVGVYSFCMCPGGRVINSSSEKNMLCTNGMSYSSRNGVFSNSAIVATVEPGIFNDDALSGIEFQRKIEGMAFTAGGGGFLAPAQTLKAFMKDTVDSALPEVSYLPGVSPSAAAEYLPAWIVDEIKSAMKYFERRMKGFTFPESVLIGAETRTSSPVRILRDDSFQSVSVGGLYPAGEGSGYSGGIVSSAVDGIRIADAIALRPGSGIETSGCGG